MKIYKVKVDPANPIEHKLKVPVNTPFGLQIIWDYDKYPTFPKDPTGYWYTGDTMEGLLVPWTYVYWSEKENKTLFPVTNGVKTYTSIYDFHKEQFSKVGTKLDFYYAPFENPDPGETEMDTKVYNWAHISVETIPADSKVDFDMTLANGDWITVDSRGISFNSGYGSIIGGDAYVGVSERNGAFIEANDLPVCINSQAYITHRVGDVRSENFGTLSLVSGTAMPNISATWWDNAKEETIEFSTPLSSITNLSATGSGGGIDGISSTTTAIEIGKQNLVLKDSAAMISAGNKLDITAKDGVQVTSTNPIGIAGKNLTLSGTHEVTIDSNGGDLQIAGGFTTIYGTTTSIGGDHVTIGTCGTTYIGDNGTVGIGANGTVDIGINGYTHIGDGGGTVQIGNCNGIKIDQNNSPICPDTAGNIAAAGQLELSGTNGVYIFSDTTQFAKLTTFCGQTICSVLAVEPLPELDRGMQLVGTNVGLSADQELVIGSGCGVTFSTSALTICGKTICLTKFLADYGS